MLRALPPAEESDAARRRVHGLLRLHGWNATSFQVLEPGYHYWFDGEEACVAYVDTGSAWVAAGAPIAAEAELPQVAGRFRRAAAEAGRSACFFGAEERFAAGAQTARLAIGEQPVWDPSDWEAKLRGSRSLREQLRRARAKGVSVRALTPEEIASPDAPQRPAVEALLARWLASKRMAPMGFLVRLELFGFAEERRYFAAEQDGRLVGLLAAVPIYARQGWLLEDLLRDPSAPNGTAEVLVDAAMRAAAAGGSRYVTLGLAPLAGEVDAWLRTARAWGALLYDFDGVRAFKAKLRPDRWDPIYLVYPEGAPVRALHAALRAFAGGGLLRFGLQTVLRGPPVVVRVLAALLVPWTILLASVAPARWFPARGVQLAWIAFDAALFAALWSLSKRWRPRLAWILAGVISLDAVTTLVEALWFNVPRLQSAAGAAAVGLGVLAPFTAAAVLWGALLSRQRGAT